MTTKQVAAMIAGVGLPYAYDHFEPEETPGNPPYICFFYGETDDLYADNSNYAAVWPLYIELYTDNKDFDLEARVEAALVAAELPWQKSKTEYIESERMYQTTYNTEVSITNGE